MERKSRMEPRVVGGVEFRRGSDNIFADIGLPNPEELLVKAQLTAVIQQEIKRRKLTQKQIGEILGVNQAEVSRLMRSFGKFSVGRLLIFLNRLGRDVEIVIPPARRLKKAAQTLVKAA